MGKNVTISADYDLDVNEMAANVIAAYDATTPAERQDGHDWYPEALELAAMIADTFGITVEQAAKLIAATSSETGWGQNSNMAVRVAAAYRDTGTEFPEGIGVRSGPQWKIICQIMEGTYAGKSPKWSAFAANILGDPDQVTVDRHAMRIAMADGVMYTSITLGNYRKIADAYRIAADARNVTPRVMQATTWVACRNRRKNSTGKSYAELYG